MENKEPQKLCWNCDASVGMHLSYCPYCGVDLTRITPVESTNPWQAVRREEALPQEEPKAPFGSPYYPSELAPPGEDWKKALEEKKGSNKESEEEEEGSSRTELIALLLLLPGIVFFLFGLVLILFSKEGVLTLRWNQSFAIFYFLGSIPLLFLGWRALR